jgi:hypothetical protein
MKKSAALILAGGLATAAVTAIPEAEARPWGWRGGWGGYYGGGWGGGYYRRGWGWGGGGAVAAGIAGLAIGGLIGSALATPAYAYGYPAYGYPAYGYPAYSYPAYAYPAYGYAPVQTVTYVDPGPAVAVRRRVVYRSAPAYRRVIVRRAYEYGPRVAVYRPRAQFYGPATYRQRVVYGARPAYRGAAVRARSFRSY